MILKSILFVLMCCSSMTSTANNCCSKDSLIRNKQAAIDSISTNYSENESTDQRSNSTYYGVRIWPDKDKRDLCKILASIFS